MSEKKVKIGIIGGSALDDVEILEGRKEIYRVTPYGSPSDVLIEGRINGVDCILLARHGRRHSISPSNVNYRANIWALKDIGCTHILASTLCGSLQEELKPGDIVIVDGFIDRTTKRIQTYYDGNENSPVGVCHIPMEPAFCHRTREVLIETAMQQGIPVHDKGTVVAIEGPRFSSKAESLMFKQWGGDLVNMTTCPEVVLAKEAGLLYATIGLVTDYDCWRPNTENVCVEDVLETGKSNVDKILQLFTNAVTNIAQKDWTQTINDLQKTVHNAVMIPHDE
ncbi:S-methyl-5'-thioadenosine phosphorylase [Pseudolycoriella hygida]|uniref:S-methyl-5'-thioadenosine phosphorylase n=1 Tax=Pseudolycoriella hygida TaxID=35572 RepID=A0A9Q0MKS0_9DIPT|nr:S-methyl-5'-thioadenosine phosphorylase [Pseudolycoriella hygida]